MPGPLLDALFPVILLLFEDSRKMPPESHPQFSIASLPEISLSLEF